MNHVTIDSGHTRHSPASEVRLDVLRAMQAWTELALAKGALVPLPNLDGYRAHASRYRDSLAVSVFGSGGKLALATFLVSATGDAGSWAHFFEVFIGPMRPLAVVDEPEAPYCAVKLHIGVAIDREAAGWLGDFERCVAWAWLRRIET